MEQGYGTEFRPDEQPLEQRLHTEALGKRDGSYNPGMHSENLYDQNEGAGGEVIDLRTGRRIDNSTETDETIVKKLGGHVSDGPTPINDEKDAAAKWLAEHDRAA